jgi:hypothetical protein
MKCPECLKKGLNSKVYDRGGWATCVHTPKFYDEQGRMHDHDNNIYTHEYECSNGHKFEINETHKCWCEQ